MDTLDFTHFMSGEDGYEWFYGHMTNTIYLIKFDADDWQSRLIELSFLTEIDDSYLNMGFSYRDPESPKDKLRPQDIEAINKGYRYRDIAVISNNLESYASLVKVIADSYNIPIFMDEKVDITQNVFIKYLIFLHGLNGNIA